MGSGPGQYSSQNQEFPRKSGGDGGATEPLPVAGSSWVLASLDSGVDAAGQGRLEQIGALPGLAEHVLGQEREDGLVPDDRVTGREYPVVLIGKVKELHVLG
jgi:hypothetical protein